LRGPLLGLGLRRVEELEPVLVLFGDKCEDGVLLIKFVCDDDGDGVPGNMLIA
jgi:hypothetical protein